MNSSCADGILQDNPATGAVPGLWPSAGDPDLPFGRDG